MTALLRLRCIWITWAAVLLAAMLPPPSRAQQKGEPGRFDFYVLDMPWGPEFCRTIKDVSASCQPQTSFVLHGLWPQNRDGTWPVFCSEEEGPKGAAFEQNLDITPDRQLLDHEWSKHGTCAAVGPAKYFAMGHAAFWGVQVPARFRASDRPLHLRTAEILTEFARSNPQIPAGGLVLSCREGRLTAVEACFDKSLQPMRCEGLTPCAETTLEVAARP